MTGETFRATMICRDTDNTAFVFDYGYAHQETSSVHIDCGTAAGAFQTLVQAKFAAAFPINMRITKYRFACVDGTSKGEIGFVEVVPVVDGEVTGEILPPEIAISMKRNTGHSSRRDRGRVFFGPVSASFRVGDNGDQVDTTVTELQDIMNLGKATLTVGGALLQPVILSGTGTYTGRKVVNVAMAPVFVHHKSRRTRAFT